MTYYYGVSGRRDILDIARKVCTVPAFDKPYALEILLETCAAETLLATFKDPTPGWAGASLCQIDPGTFNWLAEKYGRNIVGDQVKTVLNVDLRKVYFAELDDDPLLGFLFCRMRYLTIAGPIPATLEDRALYWKKFYNSSAGRGTPEGYIEKVNQCRVAELLADNSTGCECDEK